MKMDLDNFDNHKETLKKQMISFWSSQMFQLKLHGSVIIAKALVKKYGRKSETCCKVFSINF